MSGQSRVNNEYGEISFGYRNPCITFVLWIIRQLKTLFNVLRKQPSVMIVKVADNSTEDLSRFIMLPPELQVTILSFLPTPDLFSVAKSCRFLSSLSKHQSLWTNLTLDWKNINENYKFCKDLVQSERFSKLRSAEITYKQKFLEVKFINAEASCYKELSNIIDLILDMETLKSFKVDKNILVTESQLTKICQKSSLTGVDVSGYHITPSILSSFGDLTNLRILKLYDMKHLNINSEDFEHLFSSLRNLKVVEVPSANIKDSAVARLVSNNANLSHVVIDHCNLVSSKSIQILAKACPDLQLVSMIKCDRLRDADALNLISSCPQLRHIGLSRTSDKTLRKILQVCPMIQSVSLEYCQLVSEGGLTELLTTAPRFENLELIHDTILRVANNFDKKFKINNPDSRAKILIKENRRILHPKSRYSIA